MNNQSAPSRAEAAIGHVNSAPIPPPRPHFTNSNTIPPPLPPVPSYVNGRLVPPNVDIFQFLLTEESRIQEAILAGKPLFEPEALAVLHANHKIVSEFVNQNKEFYINDDFSDSEEEED